MAQASRHIQTRTKIPRIERKTPVIGIEVSVWRSNIAADWEAMSGGADWPDDEQWAALRKANQLEELEPARRVEAEGGVVELVFDLPMPSVSLVELTKERQPCRPTAASPSSPSARCSRPH